MNISIIAAISFNNVIGKNNSIPWFLPADQNWFKFCTIKKPIIMGNYTWKSIKNIPLKNRINIVITRKKKISNKKVIFFNSIQKAILYCQNAKEIMIIGGENLYRQTINIAERLYLTYINTKIYKGDRFFPKYKKKEWKTVFKILNKSDLYNKYDYTFEILKKVHE